MVIQVEVDANTLNSIPHTNNLHWGFPSRFFNWLLQNNPRALKLFLLTYHISFYINYQTCQKLFDLVFTPDQNTKDYRRLNYLFLVPAVLLIVSALLKAWMMVSDPFADVRTGYSIGLLSAVVIIELIVGYLLIAQNSFEMKWTLSFTIFASFFCLSTTRFALGYKVCGCFGNIAVSQEWSIFLNTILITCLLGILLVFKLRVVTVVRTGLSEIWSFLKPYRFESLGLSAGLLIFIGLTTAPTSKWIQSIWSNQQVATEPVWFDDLAVGVSQPGLVTLTNKSELPVTVVGAEKSCGCIALDLKPIVILPGDEVQLPFLLTPTQTGPFHQRLVYFLDSQHQQRVHVEILGTCKEKLNELSKL